MAITSAGLGSGIDIEGIITKLMTVEAQPLNVLARKEVSYQAKLTAYGTFSSMVSSFQSSVAALNNSNSTSSVSASSSNADAVSVSSSSIAVPGSYSVEVSQLAKAQQLVAAGQSSLTASIGTGTISFDFGAISGGVFNPGTGQYAGASFVSNGSGIKTVTISAANDSLTGIRDAVNAAGIGVTATIINDGSGTPYRLAFTSGQGAANGLKISVSPAAGGLDNFLSNDPAGVQHLAETVTAQDALLKLNGLNISSSTNSVSSAISGVTLNLQKTNAGSPATISVGKDSSAYSKLVNGFVKAYNDLDALIKELTKYDPKNSANNGLLIGDSTVRSVQSQIRSTITGVVPGLTGAYTNLSQVGVSFNRDGTLAFDSSKLSTALTANANDVVALFSTIGRPTDSLISYSSSTSSTAIGKRAVDITQIATQGYTTGNVAAGTTITAGVDDTLNVTVDGASIAITLSAGSYSVAGLNSAIQSAINGNAALVSAGTTVAVTDAAGVITITSNRYGSSSAVVVTGGSGAANLGLAAPASTVTGVDVAGTIDGSAATASGQYLTSSDGLRIQVKGGATGARGTVDFSRGYGYLLDKLVSGFTGSKGSITARTDGVNSSIDKINDQREVLNRRLAAIEKRYRAQFTALDMAVSSMNQTSTYLTQQLNALTNTKK